MQEQFWEFLKLILYGSLGGFMAGLLGVGGGIVYVLIFTTYFTKMGISSSIIVPATIANSMFAIFCAGIGGTIKQLRDKNFYLKEVMLTGFFAGSVSILVSVLISNATWYTPARFNLFFIFLLMYLAFKVYMGKELESIPGAEEKPSTLKLIIIGIAVGILAAFSGVGGGVIMVPFLNQYLKYSIKKSASISLGVISIMALFTVLYYSFLSNPGELNTPYHLGIIIYNIAIPVAIGSLAFSSLGVSTAKKLSAKVIRLIFTAFIIFVIIKMISRLF